MDITNKLLVIGHVWPQPNASAAGEHLVHLLDIFLDLQYTVHFVSAAQKPDNYTDLDTLPITTHSVALNDNNFDAFIRELAPSVVLFDRFMVEEQFSWRIKKYLPDTLLILDTEDIHFLRKQREESLKGKTSTVSLSDIAKRELASIYRCDMSLIISEAEMELLTRQYGVSSNLLFYLPLLSQKVNIKDKPTFQERENMIFVGNFLHAPNWEAVQTLKKEIWPRIRKKKPELSIYIYGAYAGPKHLQLNNEKEGFFVKGFVEDIDSELEKAKLLLAPLSFGAGQKGKLLKAMQSGTPSVTTTIGCEAMQFDKQWPGMIADDYDDFAAAVITLYSNPGIWNQKQFAIEPLVNSHFQYDAYLEKFDKALRHLKDNFEELRMANILGQILWHHSMRSTEFMSRWIMEKESKKVQMV